MQIYFSLILSFYKSCSNPILLPTSTDQWLKFLAQGKQTGGFDDVRSCITFTNLSSIDEDVKH